MKKILIITLIATLILLYDKVDALTYTQELTQVGDTYLQWGNFNNSGWTYSNDYYIHPIQTTTNTEMTQIDIILVDRLNTTNVDYVQIPFNVGTSTHQYAQTYQPDMSCEEWNPVNGKYECTSWTQNGNVNYQPFIQSISSLQFQVKVQYEYEDGTWGGWNSCDINNNAIICPTNRKYISKIDINYLLYSDDASLYSRVSIGAGFKFYNNASPTQAIHEQTQQQQNNFNEIMNETQQYNDKTNTNINGANETIEYEQAESQLIESMEVNESIMDDIFINPQASAFIWNIADQLRNMNPSIIILMTSILGIGIFKLILNR